MFLLDTNVLILGIKAEQPDSKFLEKVIKQKQLYLSAVTVAEFLSRASDEEEGKGEKLIARFPVLTVDLATARVAAEYRKQSLKKKKAELLDCFMAAQAKIHKLTLVTNNKADFPMKDIKVISPD